MRLSTIASAAWLASTCAADNLAVLTECYQPGVVEGSPYWCANKGVFITSSGAKSTGNIDSGCHNIGLPHMQEFCIDWGKGRAHFRFASQGKRCLQAKTYLEHTVCPRYAHCRLITFEEVACSWREAPQEGGTSTTPELPEVSIPPRPEGVPDEYKYMPENGFTIDVDGLEALVPAFPEEGTPETATSTATRR